VALNDQRRIGLARALSKLGYCSRSRALELIRSGRVSVKGKLRSDPQFPVIQNRDQIIVDGKIVNQPQKIYLMMNKPRGVVTTASDEKGRATVYDLLNSSSCPEDRRNSKHNWVAPVGRLDKASEGLLLLTNDSEWGARIAAPETHLDKTYHVQIARMPDTDFIGQLTHGVWAKDNEELRAKQARLLRSGEKNCWLEIVLDEGRNRHIRRMMEALGVAVLRLLRVAIGPLQLGDLAKGRHRPLTSDEKRMLDRAMVEKTRRAILHRRKKCFRLRTS
jgi:23S rRNA pseudouridine2605 synthase